MPFIMQILVDLILAWYHPQNNFSPALPGFLSFRMPAEIMDSMRPLLSLQGFIMPISTLSKVNDRDHDRGRGVSEVRTNYDNSESIRKAPLSPILFLGSLHSVSHG